MIVGLEEWASRISGCSVEMKFVVLRDSLAMMFKLDDKITLFLDEELSEEEIVVAVAHELAHLIEQEHSTAHDRAMVMLLKDASKRFELDIKKLLRIKDIMDKKAGLEVVE